MPSYLSSNVVDFFRVTFTYDADLRPDAFEIMKEPWLAQGVDSVDEYDSTLIGSKGVSSQKTPSVMTHKQRVAKLLGVKKVSDKPKAVEQQSKPNVLSESRKKREESNVVHHTHLHLTHVNLQTNM